eukprot:gene803-1283_t
MRGIGAYSFALKHGYSEPCKPTSGWFALSFASQICDKVHMYGFSKWKKRRAGKGAKEDNAPASEAKYHYFDSVEGVTNVHSFDLSMRVYETLAEKYGIVIH